MTTCPRCDGTGCEPGTSRVIPFRSNTWYYTECINCEQCDGDGKMTANERQEGGEHYRKVPGE